MYMHLQFISFHQNSFFCICNVYRIPSCLPAHKAMFCKHTIYYSWNLHNSVCLRGGCPFKKNFFLFLSVAFSILQNKQCKKLCSVFLSVYKHRPLIKRMMILTTTRYIVQILGSYLADGANICYKILKHMIRTNTEEMLQD